MARLASHAPQTRGESTNLRTRHISTGAGTFPWTRRAVLGGAAEEARADIPRAKLRHFKLGSMRLRTFMGIQKTRVGHPHAYMKKLRVISHAILHRAQVCCWGVLRVWADGGRSTK